MSQLEGLIVKESVEHEAESTHTESVFLQADAVLCSSFFLLLQAESRTVMMSLAGIQGHLQDELTSLHSCRFCSYKGCRLQCSRRPQSLSCNKCVCVCV